MKHQLLLLAAFAISSILPSSAQVTNIRHSDKLEMQKNVTGVKRTNFTFDKTLRIAGAPENVSVFIEPKQGDAVAYLVEPGFSFYEPQKGQLSVYGCVSNTGTAQVDLDKVTIEYDKGNQKITKTIVLAADQLKVDPGYTWCWQNGRDYHVNGDVIFLESPLPTEATFRFYFKNYLTPITITKKLQPYNTGLTLPFKQADLRENEYWSSYAMHGGGDQVFAYDMGVSGYKDGWSDLLPNKDGSKNDHFRIWGKPIYAMADGYVLEFLNECPNNAGPMPGGLTEAQGDQFMADQKTNYWGPYANQGGGGGNHLNIRHGGLVALYAHMQKGSIPAKFLSKNAVVKKGDFLGYAGNAGNSTAPHLHVHVKSYKDDNTKDGEWFRPLIFNNGYVIGKDNYPSPFSNVAWSSLDKEGITGLQGKSSFIYPGNHPYCAYPTNWGEVCKFGISNDNFQSEFDKIWTCGYYPIWVDGYDAGGKTYFNVIVRPSAGVQWVARHNMDGTAYQTEYNKWDNEGYRLLFVDSYKRNGAVNYTAVWVKDGKPKPLAYHGQTLAYHEANFKANSDKGWVPVNVAVLSVGNETYVTAIWEKKNTGGFYARPAMTLQQYKDYFKDYSDKQKLKLVYLNAYTKNGVPMLSGIWYKTVANYGTWWAKHHLNTPQLQTEYNTQLGNGLLSRAITGYEDGGVQHFEGIWSK
ncbi:MAG: peptidoglycan DD-metalloendopeptidase family protein [Chitinophagaceae bacterium]